MDITDIKISNVKCYLSLISFSCVLVNALKCYVTELEVDLMDERKMPIIDNGTGWKWWPMDKFLQKGEDQMVECVDYWHVCASRQPQIPRATTKRVDPFDPYYPKTTIDPNTTEPTTTTTTEPPIPPKCIACGKSTWKRVGLGMEEGEEFVSMGCYGSLMAKEITQMSCNYNPRGMPGCRKMPFSPRPGPSSIGGDICSQCFCDNDDGCNGSPKLSITIGNLIGIFIIGWIYGLIQITLDETISFKLV